MLLLANHEHIYGITEIKYYKVLHRTLLTSKNGKHGSDRPTLVFAGIPDHHTIKRLQGPYWTNCYPPIIEVTVPRFVVEIH